MDTLPLAWKVFIFGFTGVFITLALLMISIIIAGTVLRARKESQEG